MKGRTAAIEEEVSSYVRSQLRNEISKELERLERDDVVLLTRIENKTKQHIEDFLMSTKIDEIAREATALHKPKDKASKESQLDKILDDQMRSAGRLKTVMINLFVIVNIGIMIFYIFYGPTGLQSPFFVRCRSSLS